MVSGLVVLSNAVKGCYPFKESIQSFLPVCDEICAVYDVFSTDDTREIVESIGDKKIRIIPSAFNLKEWGWIGYGIMRTAGYHACSGKGVILMFDADGVLHEKDYDTVRNHCREMEVGKVPNAYWNKHRIYKPTLYHPQHKHSGIYNKAVLGDLFDFFHGNKGIPNFSRYIAAYPEHAKRRTMQFDVRLYGYEHVWDTEECIRNKVAVYGRMMDRVSGQPFKTDPEYYDAYRKELVEKMESKGLPMTIEEQPAIIQDKLKEVTDKHFGYNFFS